MSFHLRGLITCCTYIACHSIAARNRRGPEIRQHHSIVQELWRKRKEDVFRLEIAVDNSSAVEKTQATGNLPHNDANIKFVNQIVSIYKRH